MVRVTLFDTFYCFPCTAFFFRPFFLEFLITSRAFRQDRTSTTDIDKMQTFFAHADSFPQTGPVR